MDAGGGRLPSRGVLPVQFRWLRPEHVLPTDCRQAEPGLGLRRGGAGVTVCAPRSFREEPARSCQAPRSRGRPSALSVPPVSHSQVLFRDPSVLLSVSWCLAHSPESVRRPAVLGRGMGAISRLRREVAASRRGASWSAGHPHFWGPPQTGRLQRAGAGGPLPLAAGRGTPHGDMSFLSELHFLSEFCRSGSQVDVQRGEAQGAGALLVTPRPGGSPCRRGGRHGERGRGPGGAVGSSALRGGACVACGQRLPGRKASGRERGRGWEEPACSCQPLRSRGHPSARWVPEQREQRAGSSGSRPGRRAAGAVQGE